MPLIKLNGEIVHVPSDVRIGLGPALGDQTQRRDYLRLGGYDFQEQQSRSLHIAESIIGWGCALGYVFLILQPFLYPR